MYFGVATQLDAVGRGTKHCHALFAFFVDIDFKELAESVARAKVAAFSVDPSAIVNMEAGSPVLVLREPFELQDGAAPRAKAILRALATAIGGDLCSAEPAHILRLPGTTNWTYDPPRAVVVERVAPEQLYSLDEILAALPPTSPNASRKAEEARRAQPVC